MPSAVSHKIDDYESLLVALQNILGVVVPDDQRICLVERMESLLADYKLDSLPALADGLQSGNNAMRTDVLDAISRRRQDWHMSSELKSILHKYIFTQLPEQAQIWVVGCGQGQFAYAVAMEAAKYEQNSGEVKKIQIAATDISADDISLAKQAQYNAKQLSTLSDAYKRLYVTTENSGTGIIKGKIRQMVNFSQCDLKQDFQSLGKMDIIICPEILVYFSNGIREGILGQFSDLLKAGGILLTGNNQMVPEEQGFERVEHPAGVFYRQKK